MQRLCHKKQMQTIWSVARILADAFNHSSLGQKNANISHPLTTLSCILVSFHVEYTYLPEFIRLSLSACKMVSTGVKEVNVSTVRFCLSGRRILMICVLHVAVGNVTLI